MVYFIDWLIEWMTVCSLVCSCGIFNTFIFWIRLCIRPVHHSPHNGRTHFLSAKKFFLLEVGIHWVLSRYENHISIDFSEYSEQRQSVLVWFNIWS
jgi:hypothetical protein